MGFVRLSDLLGIFLTKMNAPLTNGFVGDFNASTGQNFFNITKTESEPVIKPNSMANNLPRKPEAMIDIRVFHRFKLHHSTAPQQLDSAVLNQNSSYWAILSKESEGLLIY